MVDTAAPRPTRPHGLRTRQRILDAAVDCLVDLGYAGTTTLAVQARAGVSRGSLLHQFPSRDELLVAAVTHLAEARLAELVAQVRRNTPRRDLGDLAIEALWESLQGPLFQAATELWVAARTNPGLRDVLQPAERELGTRGRSALGELFGASGAHPDFADVFDLVLTSMRGAALVRYFDPSPRRDAANLRRWKRLAHDVLDHRPDDH